MSRSSISRSAASENPNAIRNIRKFFSTYNIGFDIDLSELNIVDMGDIKMHVTDIPQCHRNIEHGIVEVLQANPETLPISIGGDHSITCPLIKRLKKNYRMLTGLYMMPTCSKILLAAGVKEIIGVDREGALIRTRNLLLFWNVSGCLRL